MKTLLKNPLNQAIIVATTMLITRIAFTQSFLFIFLIWNLFLAAIPFWIARYCFKNRDKNSLLTFVFLLFLWLIFFPNAPYILTDLKHLTFGESNLFWYDLIMILIFAFCGLLFGLSSLDNIIKTSTYHFNLTTSKIVLYSSILLAGIGIYIGRVLRWNSWDIVTDPLGILEDLIQILLNPIENKFVYLTSFAFSALIFLGYKFFLYGHNHLKS